MGGASEHKDEDDEERRVALQRLIHFSRSPTQQGLLAARNAVPSLLSLITQDPPSLLLILKLLRNLCAGEPSNQQAFLQSSGAQSVALIIDKALKACDIQTEKCVELDSVLQVSLQLLGNACGGGEAQKESVWMAFFPERFRSLVLMRGQEKIFEPLCMVLYTCSHGATHRLLDLCRGDGARLLSCCLQAAASHDCRFLSMKTCGKDSGIGIYQIQLETSGSRPRISSMHFCFQKQILVSDVTRCGT